MGSINADRIPISHLRRRCETVADMLAQRWSVISKCEVCGLVMQVDLALIIKVKGPGVSLWNRKARCRRLACSGWVTFHAQTSARRGFEALAAEWPEPYGGI